MKIINKQITTKTGDFGKTTSISGKRVSKNNPSIEFFGTIDELNAFLGLTKNIEKIPNELINKFIKIQKFLLPFIPTNEAIKYFEKEINSLEKNTTFDSFVNIDNNKISASINVLRVIARRAERTAISAKANKTTIVFFNRLSDYLFLLGLKYNS